MSNSLFGNLFKKLSTLDEQLKEVDHKLEQFQKAAVAAADKLQDTTENLIDTADKGMQKLDSGSQNVSEQLEEPEDKAA